MIITFDSQIEILNLPNNLWQWAIHSSLWSFHKIDSSYFYQHRIIKIEVLRILAVPCNLDLILFLSFSFEMCTNRYNFVSQFFFRHVFFCGEVKGQNIQSLNALDFEMFTPLEVEKYIIEMATPTRDQVTLFLIVVYIFWNSRDPPVQTTWQ